MVGVEGEHSKPLGPGEEMRADGSHWPKQSQSVHRHLKYGSALVEFQASA